MPALRRKERAYQELASHEDHDSLSFQGRLGVQRGDGVLDLLERKTLQRRMNSKYAPRVSGVRSRVTYSKFLNDSADAQGGGRLEGQHGVVALYIPVGEYVAGASIEVGFTYVEGHELLPVAVEGVVVELNELLCRIGLKSAPIPITSTCPDDIAAAGSLC